MLEFSFLVWDSDNYNIMEGNLHSTSTPAANAAIKGSEGGRPSSLRCDEML
jgi:hypothetical protein